MEKITFMTSLLTFYLKGEISQQDNFIKLKIPNTILGFIPLGSRGENLPINQISMVGTSFHLLFGQLLFGIILVFIGLASMKISAFSGLIMLAVGVFTVINSFQTILVIDLTSGRSIAMSFVVFEKSKAAQAAYDINKLISERIDDTNTRQQTDRLISDNDRIVNAINNRK
ncbi:MAG: hypothetical protein K2N60_00615 [Oscillospiraceae bacterium]|nr:hypothetical protein [Oscillospiraceae bacterium]